MKLTEEARKEIDDMSYEELLRRWRFVSYLYKGPVGDPMFTGEVGEYYTKVMNEKRDAIGQAAHVQASKNIGYEVDTDHSDFHASCQRHLSSRVER